MLCCGFSDDAASHLSLGPRSFRKPIEGGEADQRATPAVKIHRPGAPQSPKWWTCGQVEALQWEAPLPCSQGAYSTSMSTLWTPSGEHLPKKEEGDLDQPPPSR